MSVRSQLLSLCDVGTSQVRLPGLESRLWLQHGRLENLRGCPRVVSQQEDQDSALAGSQVGLQLSLLDTTLIYLQFRKIYFWGDYVRRTYYRLFRQADK